MSSSNFNRRLAAILAADVVGYSRLMGDDETGTLERLKKLHGELVQPKITEYGGRVVKLMGDGLLAEFPSAVDAVQCAVDIQQTNAQRDAGVTDKNRIHLRIGINLGDIIVEGRDIFGDGVNVAARLEALAITGGICISESVKTAVGKNLPHNYEFMGDQKVKNIEESIRAYKVDLNLNEKSRQSLSSPQRSAPADKPSIAVLAFNNMSGDPEQEYFSDGITEDIITELSRFSGLFVIARNSSFAYKDTAVDVKSVALELGVRYMLEGSVRRAGNRLRINAQLLDTNTATHIWAERYDGDLDDIFDLQDEITRSIVGAIAPQIEMAEVEKSRTLPANNLTSYELSLKAQAVFNDNAQSGDFGSRQATINAAQAALDTDAKNTLALWLQGYCYAMQYLYRQGDDPELSLASARDIAARFIQADSNNPRAYTLRGIISILGREFDAAISDFERAFALNPNFAINAMAMAWGESLAGMTKQAREHAHLALKLSPRDLDLWLGDVYLALLQASFADGDFEEAKKWGALAVQMTPKAPIRRTLMIASCIYTNDPESAAKHAHELQDFAPDFIPGILSGEVKLYKLSEHNALLTEGLRKAGL